MDGRTAGLLGTRVLARPAKWPGCIKMRVLWMCNVPLAGFDAMDTGSWLGCMARALVDSQRVELGIIAPNATAKQVRADTGSVSQWLVPHWFAVGRNGLPRSSVVAATLQAVAQFRPDVVHVWGTESFWGLLVARGMVTPPALLTMQGIKSEVGRWYWADLTGSERRSSTGPKEWIRAALCHGSVPRVFQRWKTHEEEIIAAFPHVAHQTPWQAAHVRAVNRGASLYQMDLPLRREILGAAPWDGAASTPQRIFCSAAYCSPAKGLHVAIRALRHLRGAGLDVELRIAGKAPGSGFLADGYLRWLRAETQRQGLERCVRWLGPLHAADIVEELRLASAALVPSFIESYGLAVAEAQTLGVPVVAAYNGGAASLGRDEQTCLFFPPGDDDMCAYQLLRILTTRHLACQLSAEARRVALRRHDSERILQQQLAIYDKLCRVGGERACGNLATQAAKES